MQHQQSTPAGPPTTHWVLHRATGAHDIVFSLLLADLASLLLALVLGALLEPLIGGLFQACRVLLHDSLPLDIAALVIACCLAGAILRTWVLRKDAKVIWVRTLVLFLLVVVSAAALYYIEPAWILIPSPVFPPAAPPSLSWSPPSSAGIAVAAILYLLVHIKLWQRERRERVEKLRTFSRAHEGGPLCGLLEQVYGYYRQGLARFDPPPVEHLKTPRTFYFLPRRPGESEDEPDMLARPGCSH